MTVSIAYPLALKSLLEKEINFTTDTIKAMLCTSAYVPDITTHQYKSSVTGEVAAGGGYSLGGVTLSGKTISVNNKLVTLDSNDPIWTTSTFTCRYLIFYASVGSNPLLSYVDFESDLSTVAQDFIYIIPSTGFFSFLVS